jgi:hypothetical protein
MDRREYYILSYGLIDNLYNFKSLLFSPDYNNQRFVSMFDECCRSTNFNPYHPKIQPQKVFLKGVLVLDTFLRNKKVDTWHQSKMGL